MFETLIARAQGAAERRAAARADALAAALDGALPGDVTVAVGADGVGLTGRGLERRLALDPALKWVVAEAIR
jgi:hypothetical protein